MTKFTMENSDSVKLMEGKYKVMVTKADIIVKGQEKLVVDFTLENGEKNTQFLPLWHKVVKDMVAATGQSVEGEKVEADTDYFIGLEGELEIVKVTGKGEHEGETFYNAASFTKAEAPEEKKNV